jgi:hypothetical protein
MARLKRPKRLTTSAGQSRTLTQMFTDPDGDDPPQGGSGRRDDGGAGVREPRRPRPTRPGAAEMLAEPVTEEPPAELASS